jgi:hypothetical protein
MKELNLKEQFRYLVEHGVSDHGNTIGEACDKAYEIMLPKLIAVCKMEEQTFSKGIIYAIGCDPAYGADEEGCNAASETHGSYRF